MEDRLEQDMAVKKSFIKSSFSSRRIRFWRQDLLILIKDTLSIELLEDGGFGVAVDDPISGIFKCF